MRLFCALILAMVVSCSPAYADNQSISLINGAWSSHSGSDGYTKDGEYREYNEVHSSLGITYSQYTLKEQREHSLFTFVNSYHNRGYAYTYTSLECGGTDVRACIGWKAGLTTGYKESRGYAVLPFGAVGLTLSYSFINASVMYIPLANVTTLQLSTELYTWG